MGAREVVKQGDSLLRDGAPVGAIDEYARAAKEYAEAGFALKAVAIWKQIREVIRTHWLADCTLDVEARQALIALYRSLGLEADARGIEAENEIDVRLH